MNALVIIETLTPAVYSEPNGIDALISKLETEVRATPTDISTPAGRKAVASLAHKIARSKTALDSVGKELGAEWKAKAKLIDVERAKAWDRLEALQAEVRKPLDDYEAAELARTEGHLAAINGITGLACFEGFEPNSAQIIRCLVALEALPARDWQEFKQRALTARTETFAKLTALKEATLQRETETAELDRLRAECAARDQQAREDRIAAEAAAKATRDAEAKAAREAQETADRAAEVQRKADKDRADAVARAEQTERDAKAAASKAAQDKKDAAAKAERSRLAAIEAERQRVADVAAAEAAETARREADKAHRKTVNSEALAALVAAGLTVEQGIVTITAIVRGQIPHIKVVY